MIVTKKEDIFFVKAKSWNGDELETDHVVIVAHDGKQRARILFMIYSFADRYNQKTIAKITGVFRGVGDCVFEADQISPINTKSTTLDCHWHSRAKDPHPGLYASIGFASQHHPSSESVVDFLRRTVNPTLTEIEEAETRAY